MDGKGLDGTGTGLLEYTAAIMYAKNVFIVTWAISDSIPVHVV